MNTYYFKTKMPIGQIFHEEVYENDVLIGVISTVDRIYADDFSYQLIKIFQSITDNVPNKIIQFLNNKQRYNNRALLKCIDDHFPQYKEELEKYSILL
jgi:hypothetical protein